MEKLNLTKKWDKVFPKSDKVDHKKVTFHNRYGITLAADLYKPKDAKGKLPAIAVSGPFGAVKEQASGLYAQTMAERGFFTIAFDPSYTGESGGEPRNVASPDINTEDFSVAVDYLSTSPEVNPDHIGLIGICGFGGMAVNAASMDTRIKATVASTMYDMSRVNARGYFDAMDADALVMAAAVADYRPAQVAQDKIKKHDGELSIELERTDDILGWVGEHKPEQLFVCGFSMETKDLIENSTAKLHKKNMDMIVANNVKVPGAGFGVDTNVVTLITESISTALPLQSKDDVAMHIADVIVEAKRRKQKK